ncbi:MAG: GABA permease, partial [Corynebacterium variabile]|nr:GABA permease [Corynebacterium variabile]
MAIATGRETEPSGNPDRPGRGNTAGSEQDAGGGTTVRKDKLKSRHITMITLGGIMGSALFIGSGNVIAKAGPAAVKSNAIGGVLDLLAMVLLGEIAAPRPAV